MGSCDCSAIKDKLMPVEQALSQMLAAIEPLTDYDTVSLEKALGRVLAEDIHSRLDIPPFDNSAMDGYALRSADLATNDTLQLAGQSFAGSPFEGHCPAGSCVRIMTGAQVPPELDAVVMQEQTCRDGDLVRFQQTVKAGNNVRNRGEEIATGDCVLPAGETLTARHLALLATVGVAKVKVVRKLKVAIFSTGDELMPLGSELKPGEIYDSNRYGIMAVLTRMDVDLLDLGVIKDDPAAIREAFRYADKAADVVITSGGVSVGEADFTREIMEEMGEINFWKLAIKPGKPFAFGRFDNSIFFGLPGNPVSALVTLYELAKPAMQKLSGAPYKAPLSLKATLNGKLKKAPGRTDYQRGVLTTDEQGQLTVTSTGHQGSGMMSSLALADCFIVLERDRGSVEDGEIVTVQPFDRLYQ